ncbi:MAG: dUTP diphosphatase [Nanobdellota archaeon]
MAKVKFKRLDKDAKLPAYKKEYDAGLDIYSNESYILKPGERHVFKTGIASSITPGHVALIWDRSGNAAKSGIKTMAGVIDCGYRGEWGIVLLNTGNEEFEIRKGDRIAQALIQPVTYAEVEETDSLEDSDRAEGGFGSTGK